MKKIIVPYLSTQDIRQKADKFRSDYWGSQIPVDILEIAEFEFDIEIRPIPNLKKLIDMDALISSNFEVLYVDNDQYINDNQINRLRFSVAHEIGHMILHKQYYESLGINSFEDYIKYTEELPEDQHSWLESHAYEFAGRLLVPYEELTQKIDEAKKMLEDAKINITAENEELIKDFITRKICYDFDVSSDVIYKRIVKEKINLIS